MPDVVYVVFYNVMYMLSSNFIDVVTLVQFLSLGSTHAKLMPTYSSVQYIGQFNIPDSISLISEQVSILSY